VAGRLVTPGKVTKALAVLFAQIRGVENDNTAGSQSAANKPQAGAVNKFVLFIAVGWVGDQNAADAIRTDDGDGCLSG